MRINNETLKRRFAYFLFWAWHLIYTVLVFGMIVPYVAWPLINEVLKENVPLHYLFYAFIMALLPFVSMYLGAKFFRKDFRCLMKYFYGFEMPLLFFLTVQIITFRDSNLGMSWLVINVIIALSVWFVFLWKQNKQDNNKENNKESNKDNNTLVWRDNPIAIVGSTLLAMVGLYFGLLFLILMMPVAVEFFIGLGQVFSEVHFKDILTVFVNPLVWLAGIFIIFTMTLFIALPVVMIYLYIGQFFRRLPSLLTPVRLAIVLVVISLNMGIFSYLNSQPQQAVFSLLEEKMDKPDLQTELLPHADEIKKGLLNAYLARYRYVSTKGLSRRINRIYRNTFKISDRLADIPQNIFNTLAMPFLYDGKNWNDIGKAQKSYESFFDTPIQKSEREAILSAVKHNWEVSRDNEAGLLDAANHYVHLNQQSIQVEENQGVATVVISQTLENLTYQLRETVLHFRLPDDAVLTGLWLSDDKKNLKKYSYASAPKGAAQSVYKAEVNRRVDPALLEQVGPYQYRLRVYPVPSKRDFEKPTEPLYVQFSYQTLIHQEANGNGDDSRNNSGSEKEYWPLPKVLEKRNLFWDKKTEQLVNGEKVNYSDLSGLFPQSLLISSKQHSLSAPTPIAYKDGDNSIIAITRDKRNEKLPDSGHFAVLIDGSYSMTRYRDALMDSLAQLSESQAQFDLYFCRETCTDAPDKYVFFGNSQTVDQLAAFSKRPHANNYDAILVLTDEGSYELAAKEKTNDLKLTPPLWLVHLGDSLPYAYDDNVLDLIYQSKGGVTQSLKEALIRSQIMVSKLQIDCGKETVILSVNNNRIWAKINDSRYDCISGISTDSDIANRGLVKLVTAKKINYLSRTINTKLVDNKQLDQLDAIHTLAKQQGIVTYYSSMLVLVNERQKEALKKAEEADDRFDREVENGKQSTTTPTDPFAVPSVPEPEEWTLLILVGVFLSVAMFRRRKYK